MGTTNTYIYTASNALNGFGTTTTLQMQYGASGNIISKPDAALTISYKNPPQIHQLCSLTGAQSSVPTIPQNISYYSFRKVKQISEGIYKYNFTYDAAEQRNKMEYRENNTLKYTRYYSGAYEVDTTAGSYRRVYYIYTPAGLTAMYVKYASSDSLYYLMTDHLGSITMVTRANGSVAETYSYDAWGRRRNATDLSYNNVPQPRCTSRGYTGHEHLAGVNLINMNGRVYDPLMGMFLSPDPILQSPNDPLNYNRYSYCLNNPLKYTDPSGELFFGLFTAISDFTYTLFNGGLSSNRDEFNRAWTRFDPTASWSKTNKAYWIDHHTFITPQKDFSDSEQLRYFFWQIPQILLGNITAHTLNMTGHVNEVNYFDGAVVVNTDFGDGGITIGPYIMGRNMMPDWRDHTFVHEYGHVLQSREWGWYYLPLVGLPSVTSEILDKYLSIGEHDNRWFEADANRKAVSYFDYHYSVEGFNELYYRVGATEFLRLMGLLEVPYQNERLRLNGVGGRNRASNMVHRFHWSDVFINRGILNTIFYH